MKKILVILMCVITLVGCNNKESKQEVVNNDVEIGYAYAECIRTADDAIKLLVNDIKDRKYLSKMGTYNAVDTIVKESFKPLIDKYGVEKILSYHRKIMKIDIDNINDFYDGKKHSFINHDVLNRLEGNTSLADKKISEWVSFFDNRVNTNHINFNNIPREDRVNKIFEVASKTYTLSMATEIINNAL